MGEVHRLIESLSGQAALQTAETAADRRAIEAAIAYLGDEDTGVGFIYSGWCQAALPHKKLANDAVWKLENDKVALLVEPGRRSIQGGGTEFVGVPYGRPELTKRPDLTDKGTSRNGLA